MRRIPSDMRAFSLILQRQTRRAKNRLKNTSVYPPAAGDQKS
jgi:hypothetical protein